MDTGHTGTALAPVWTKRQSDDADPDLALMLAQQAATQWHFDAERLAAAADRSDDGSTAVAEIESLKQQIATLKDRLAPFLNYIDLAIRFETQELLAALGATEARLTRSVRRLRPEAPWRDPQQIFAALVECRH